MAYVTMGQALGASRGTWANRNLAEGQLRKLASSPMATSFDIFLSHSYEDAEVIAGLKVLIERENLTVYVDWIEDAQADRSRVTPATADLLRQRMRHCRVLLYATSKASSSSRWMPWELGYFDGMRPDSVGILPVVQTSDTSFSGQEYLGLYPIYELIDFTQMGTRFGRRTAPGQGETLRARVAAR
jgi:hypothetical protein